MVKLSPRVRVVMRSSRERAASAVDWDSTAPMTSPS